jgi:hypothetical protein
MLLAACYETPKPPCMFLCGTGGACPDGYVCVDEDNRCHRDDPGGPAACTDDLPVDEDASTIDGALIDSSPIDAEPIDAMLIDAEPVDAFVCPPDLAPAADGSTGAPQTLVISEINPGDYIELYNNTGSPVDLDNVAFQLCSPFQYSALATVGAGVTVPAGGYATVTWPSNFVDTDTDGEVILYADSQFAVDASIMDFVCWGANPRGSRKSQAEAVGKWTTAGACAGALTMGALHRLAATDGIDAADYSTSAAPSPANCTP